MANTEQDFSKGFEMTTREKLAEAEGAIKGAESRFKAEPTVFRRIKREHGEIDGLMRQIFGASVAVRISLFPKLARELRAHGFAEEYSLYRRLARYGATREAAASAASAHQDLEALLGTLERADFSTDDWMKDFAFLMALVERHIEEEEHELMPHARQLLDHAELASLDAAYVAAKALKTPN